MSKYKVGDKVVLTVTGTEEAVCHPYYVLNDNSLNILVSSIDKCAEPLTTYTEPLEAKIRRQAAEITRLLAENKELKNKEQELTRERNQLMGRCGGLSAARIKKFNDGRLAGQNEAWELARKGMLMSSTDREVIFGSGFNAMYGVLVYHTYQEAAAKVAEWEKAKEEIKVGDIVKIREGNNNDLCVLCMSTDKKYYNAVDGYGAVYYLLTKEMIAKTGRHIDVDSFLKQIGGKQE